MAPGQITSSPGWNGSRSSTPGTTTSYLLGSKKISFASEWAFKPDGVDSVKRRFDKELQKLSLSAGIEWNKDSHVFTVQCTTENSPKIIKLFHSIIHAVIKEEDAENDSEDDGSDVNFEDDNEIVDFCSGDKDVKSSKIQKLNIWEKENGIGNSDDALEPTAFTSALPAPAFPEKIRHCKSKEIWHCQDSSILLDSLVPENILTELSILTGCQLAKDSNGRKVYIGADSEENLHAAISRLDTLRKNLTRKSYIKHIFYTEEHEDIKLIVKPFLGMKTRFFETTLLDMLYLSRTYNYAELKYALTIRCCLHDQKNALMYHPIKSSKIVPVAKDSENGQASIFGSAFTYSSRGDVLQDPERHFLVQEKAMELQQHLGETSTAVQQVIEDHVSNIEHWAAEVPSSTVATNGHANQAAISREPEPVAQAPAQSESTSIKELREKPLWDSYIEYGQELMLKRKTPFKTSERLLSNLSALRLIGQGDSSSCPSQTASPQPVVAPQLAFENAAGPVKAVKPVNPEFADDLAGLDFPVRQPSLLDDDNFTLPGPEFKPLSPRGTPSALQPLPLLRTTSEAQSRLAPSGQPAPFASQSPIKKGQENPLPRLIDVDTMQSVSELETRTCRVTMNQKAPKRSFKGSSGKPQAPKANPFGDRLPVPSPLRSRPAKAAPLPKVVDPLPEFAKQTKASFEGLMQGIRGFQGHVVVHAQFGRIIVGNLPPKFVSDEDRHHTHDAEQVIELLERKPGLRPMDGPQIDFTPIVSISPAEVQYLVDLKDLTGKCLWEPKPTAWTVLYEFLYEDRATRTLFSVEIDAETFESNVRTKKAFGAIYAHGTKRNWDFQIIALGTERSKLNKTSRDALGNTILNSLYVPSGQKKPLLLFELEDAQLALFQIMGIRVHRTSRYRSHDGLSTLNVSEISELNVDDPRPIAGKGISVFKAYSSPVARPGIQWLDFWHEVSITSTKADALLEQNKKLRLGEEAAWTPERLSKLDAAKTMFEPACQMLKQMDGVGYYNENGVARPVEGETRQRGRKQKPSAEKEVQWW